MATEYLVQGSVTLEPRIARDLPHVIVRWPDHVTELDLDQTTRVPFSFHAAHQAWLEIEFVNKDYQQTSLDQDMAVIVAGVEFFGITDPRFVWQGVYTPCYPQPWLGQQTPPPPAQLRPHDYLSWNGCWRLDFDLPVFTWMHQVLALGWIYR